MACLPKVAEPQRKVPVAGHRGLQGRVEAQVCHTVVLPLGIPKTSAVHQDGVGQRLLGEVVVALEGSDDVFVTELISESPGLVGQGLQVAPGRPKRHALVKKMH
jgi:hypothetical protein